MTMSKEREHLVSVTKKDFDIQWFHGSGAGGQHRNKHANCCRIIHRESGARAECAEHKSREQNKINAFRRLINTPKFKVWLNRKSWEKLEKCTIHEKVEEMMKPENFKVEVKVDGKWVDEKEVIHT